jgi:diguanylate cyclase (GGDEF)-like protein
MSISINIQQAIDCYRKSDAVIIVCQNNSSKLIEIAALNIEAIQVIGYENADLIKKSLLTILPNRISSIIEEFVEYGNETENDLFSVLTKVRNFAVIKKDGVEIEFKLRIVAGERIDENPLFHLILVDEQKTRDSQSFRMMIKENFSGHEILDMKTGLASRDSVIKNMELMLYYVKEKNVTASFAIIEINHYTSLIADYGENVSRLVHQHISNIFRSKLRPEDTIGSLSERTLGIILVGASQEEARMVLNRLRWAISTTALEFGTQEAIISVNIGFTQIDSVINQPELLGKCEKFMVENHAGFNNSLKFILTHDRRTESKSKDRRKNNIPTAVDRRRKDRRKE